MATTVGTVDAQVLVAVGSAAPTKVATITMDLAATRRPTRTGATVELDTRRWQRSLAIAFLRIAWHTWTNRT